MFTRSCPLCIFVSVTEVFRRQRFPKLWTAQMESTHLLLLQIAGVIHTFLRTRFLDLFCFRCFFYGFYPGIHHHFETHHLRDNIFGTFSCCIVPLQGLLKHLDFASAVRLDNWCNALSFLNNAFCTKPSFLALNPLLSCFQCLGLRKGLRIAFDLVSASENLYLHMIYYNNIIHI